MWAQLFHRMSGDPHWYEPPWHKPIQSFKDLSHDEINEIMNDPNWTKAVVFRDPSRRLLSSYLYLIDNPSQVKIYRNQLLKYSKGTTWNDFLDSVTDQQFRNIHWRPQVPPLSSHLHLLPYSSDIQSQSDFCGLQKYWRLFNYKANLETLHITGPQLLKDLGIWSEYGERGWSLTKVIKTPRGNIPANSSRYRFQTPKVSCFLVSLRSQWS